MTWFNVPEVETRLRMLDIMRREKKLKNCEAIAEIINKEFGLNITANAVIGRLYRVSKTKPEPKPGPKVDANGQTARERLEKLWFGPPVPVPDPDPEPDAETIAPMILFPPSAPVSTARTPGAITFPQLARRDCKWPTGGEREHTLFCGDVRIEGKPYCKHHVAVAYGRKL